MIRPKLKTGAQLEQERRERFAEREDILQRVLAQLTLATRHATDALLATDPGAEGDYSALALACTKQAIKLVDEHLALLKVDHPRAQY